MLDEQLPGTAVPPPKFVRYSEYARLNFWIDEGTIVVPQGPGLGIEIDEKAVARFQIN